jgi:hypothetical protein
MNSLPSEYLRSLKRPDVEEWADLFLFRPLAFLLVKSILWTPLTPNMLSLFSLVLGIAASVLFGQGRAAAATAGAAVLFVSIVVDCADGQLARLKRNGTRLGRFIDGSADYVVGLAVYTGLLVGFAGPSTRPGRTSVLILAAGASHLLHSIVFDYYRNRYLAYAHGVASSQEEDVRSFRDEYESLRDKPGQGARRTLIRMYLGYTAFQTRLSRDPHRLGPIPPAEFLRANKLVLRMWTFMGSSTQGFLLVAAMAAGRLDLYFWMMIVVLNAGMFGLFVWQARIDWRFQTSRPSDVSE